MSDAAPRRPAGGMFRSLRGFNYRVWAAGAFVSNIGTWMQRTAQDWLVLTALTHRDPTAMGIVMALQFAPMVVLLPWTGYAADRFDRRSLLMVTQAIMGLLALGLGLLTVHGVVRLWQVDGFALLLGCAAAFDAPARQTFIAELVGDADLPNAVALNATSFHAARMIGPAAAGMLIAAVGSGWVFLLNAGSFAAVLGALCVVRVSGLHRTGRTSRSPRALVEGFQHIMQRPELRFVLAMVFLFGTFALNFQIYISTMSVSAFGANATTYGFLTSLIAAGSVTGALLTARRDKPTVEVLLAATLAFAAGLGLAAVMPNAWLFGAMLVPVGIAAQTFLVSSNSFVQLSVEPALRGRVMAILLTVALGGTPIGSPVAGWIAHRFGPRWSLGMGAAASLAAAVLAALYLARHGNQRPRWRLWPAGKA